MGRRGSPSPERCAKTAGRTAVRFRRGKRRESFILVRCSMETGVECLGVQEPVDEDPVASCQRRFVISAVIVAIPVPEA